MMKAVLCKAFRILHCPFAVLMGVALLSFLALVIAFISEGFLGLEPCIFCIYQRIPFALVMALGIIFALLKKYLSIKIGLGLSALAFFINSGIAVYHTGIEQRWWESAVEGCAVPSFSDEPQSLLENIMSAPTASCMDIAWQDPILGLSMANYNILFCLGLGAICVASLILSHNKSCSPKEAN